MGFYMVKKWGVAFHFLFISCDTQWVSARHHGEKKMVTSLY
jgi:hypothetical protein